MFTTSSKLLFSCALSYPILTSLWYTASVNIQMHFGWVSWIFRKVLTCIAFEEASVFVPGVRGFLQPIFKSYQRAPSMCISLSHPSSTIYSTLGWHWATQKKFWLTSRFSLLFHSSNSWCVVFVAVQAVIVPANAKLLVKPSREFRKFQISTSVPDTTRRLQAQAAILRSRLLCTAEPQIAELILWCQQLILLVCCFRNYAVFKLVGFGKLLVIGSIP